jgi:tripartite-type tricarboxylate transporter receptor subunit TctC
MLRTLSKAAVLCSLALSLWLNPARAADDPATSGQPIRLIVPAPPGGGTDVFARLLAEIAGPKLGREIVVDNRAGAAGAVGVTLLTTAVADGNTLAFVWNGPLTAAPLTLPVTYTTRSYKPLMSIGYSSYVLCAPTGSVTDAKTYINRLKTVGALTYGNDGTGGTMQLAAERVFRKLGAKVQAVPFAGAGDVARNYAAGFVDIYGGSITPILAQVKAGTTKCFLLTGTGRNTALPDAIGLDEIGLEHESTVLWWSLIAPARTRPETLAKLEAVFTQAARSERFRAEMIRQGAVPRILPGAETQAMIEKELVDLERVARDLGLLRFGK